MNLLYISSYSYAQQSLSQAFIASKGPSVAWEVRKVSRTWGAEWITGSPKRPPSCCSDVRAAHPAVRAARIKNKTYRLLKSMGQHLKQQLLLGISPCHCRRHEHNAFAICVSEDHNKEDAHGLKCNLILHGRWRLGDYIKSILKRGGYDMLRRHSSPSAKGV